MIFSEFLQSLIAAFIGFAFACAATSYGKFREEEARQLRPKRGRAKFQELSQRLSKIRFKA